MKLKRISEPTTESVVGSSVKEDDMKYNVALVGNPNSGKTTLFNCLTGSNLYVGNWPGVTVEKKRRFN